MRRWPVTRRRLGRGHGRSVDHRPHAGCSTLVGAGVGGRDPRLSARPPALGEVSFIQLKPRSARGALRGTVRRCPTTQVPVSIALHSVADRAPLWTCAALSGRLRTVQRHTAERPSPTWCPLAPCGPPLSAGVASGCLVHRWQPAPSAGRSPQDQSQVARLGAGSAHAMAGRL
jgi:hypothetical protein